MPRIDYKRRRTGGKETWYALLRSERFGDREIAWGDSRESVVRQVASKQLDVNAFGLQHEYPHPLWEEYCEALSRGGPIEASAFCSYIAERAKERRYAREVETGCGRDEES